MLAQATALSNQRQIRTLNPFCLRTLVVWSCLVDNGSVSEERQNISMLSDAAAAAASAVLAPLLGAAAAAAAAAESICQGGSPAFVELSMDAEFLFVRGKLVPC